MRIAVLSDTHGRLRDETVARLGCVDYIIHAGDLDCPSVLEELERFAPVYAVRGNNDWGGWGLPRVLRTELGGVRFCVVHKRADVPWDLTGVDVVVCGHTHRYEEEWVLGRLWLNPGSCSFPRPYHARPTMAMLDTAEDGSFSVKKVVL